MVAEPDIKETGRRTVEGVRRAGYILVGAGDVAVSAVNDAASRVRDLPERVSEVREDAPERLEKGLDHLAARGHRRAQTLSRRFNHIDRRRFEDRTVEELRELAAARGIEGRSVMKKADLIRALRGSQ